MSNSQIEFRTTRRAGWTLCEYVNVESTNPLAGKLPPWHAIRADTQSQGRGRTGRHWVSDTGGLWLSAVLPTPGVRKKWAILPLAAGWAVIQSLQKIGVDSLRLRWPNDIMCGRRKLAGLLVEKFHPDSAVIGIGLNVKNRPALIDPALTQVAISLQELGGTCLALSELTHLLLDAIRQAHSIIEDHQFATIASDINERWGDPRRVKLSLNTSIESLSGLFRGIDAEGRLSVEVADGNVLTLEASDVSLLVETD